MKTYKVMPAEKLALEFTDGKTIEMCFNTKALAYLGEHITENEISTKSPKFYGAIIYAGAKACNQDFTVNEANALYLTLEESLPQAMNGILEEYCRASGISDADLKKNVTERKPE